MLSLSSMKLIDSFVGKTMCFLLSPLAKLKRHAPVAYPSDVQKVLIVKFWGIGSIVLTSPALERLKEKYPSCRIFFLTFEANRDVCDMIPSIDETLTIRINASITSFILDTLSVLYRLRREKFDLVADFEFFTRFSALIAFLSGAKVKAGFHAWEAYRGNLHDIRVPFNYYWHVSDNFINLATGESNFTSQQTLPRLRVPDDANTWASQFLKENGVYPEDLLIVANPNAGELALERRWPKENFAHLIRVLESRYGAKIFLIGGTGEEEHTAGILQQAGTTKAVSLAGKLSIRQLAALLSAANMAITNDSGPLHLACGVGTPTIAFFGPETPVLYGPLGSKHHVFFKNISCSPCINVHNAKTARCRHGHSDCLARITIDEVLEAVETSLGHIPRSRAMRSDSPLNP
ncbi:MAG: glycosyltransferase family 9 protein [Candidatus Hydrogenedentota bacterium]|nr:MAG: glycosyltransferase family 9 protein [Candidatus Hydrogenedentota bacterium]